ncbi:M48 family metallopeptidase [Tindallia californiensis]|uniref:YgjP-like metallopeptidase domain-containing protein n=1 Tax=Tindallia californiensis TaxID=159292 RepID=A0A1H3PQT7_9FIRM|nr:SprT family zinc-dependent metalloprotease [Tindallia californiensis]SDZ03632.1 hypothetical protein SAMN05192546_10746 [Tindallia californiensis]
MKKRTKTSFLFIDELKVEILRKKIKNMNLSVHPPDGRVRLSVPKGVDEEALRFFLTSRVPWIKKQQHRLENQEQSFPKDYIAGESHYVAGESYSLNIIEDHKEKQRVEIGNRKKELDLYVRPGKDKSKREKIMQEFYRKYLKEKIPELIRKWEPVMGVKVEDWGVKRMKTRWGTCNIRDKRIWINLDLGKKHPRCLEYIVVHEMTHLLERYHNERFKSYMDNFLPDWRSIKKELNGRQSSD